MVARLLTDRQLEYLCHRCAGRSLGETAEAMGVTKATAKQRDMDVRHRLAVATLDDCCRLLAGDEPIGPGEPADAVSIRPGGVRLPEIAARRLEEMRLRKAGRTYAVIARRFGLTYGAARHDVHVGVRQWYAHNHLPMPPELDIDQLLERIPDDAFDHV